MTEKIRKIFYIDVGDMPKEKAEKIIRDIMDRHKKKRESLT